MAPRHRLSSNFWPTRQIGDLEVGEPGLISASGFEHPASTLPTRFPAALDIGTVLRYAPRYCIRSSIRRCLSILRNTSAGNELALPLPMPSKGA